MGVPQSTPVVARHAPQQGPRHADESQSMPDALGPGHGAGAPLRRRQRRRQLSRNPHLLWRGMRRSRAHAVAVAVAVAFAARCRRVLRGVGKEEEEAVQGEARGQLRLPEEGKQCLATPQNGGACSSYGKKKLCKRVGGCMWSGSKKKGSCAQV